MALVKLTKTSVEVNGHDLSDAVMSYTLDVERGGTRLTLNVAPALKDTLEEYFEGESTVNVVIPWTIIGFLDAVDADWLEKQVMTEGDLDESVFLTALRVLKRLADANRT